MKKIILPLVLVLSMLFVSCAKISFVEKKPVSNAALVYVYSVEDPEASDIENVTKFKVFINGKSTNGFIKAYEYNTYDLKADKIILTTARDYLERQSITIDLEAGKTYYARVQSYGIGFRKFNFDLVEASVALEELRTTNLAGKYDTSKNELTELIGMGTSDNPELIKNTKNNSTPSSMSEEEVNAMIDEKMSNMKNFKQTTSNVANSVTGSKLDDIRNAYEMKKQGVLTDEEFKAMKAEILAK